jgi:hypothetical protein
MYDVVIYTVHECNVFCVLIAETKRDWSWGKSREERKGCAARQQKTSFFDEFLSKKIT